MNECTDPKENGERCGACLTDLALQAADPRYGASPGMEVGA